MRELAATLGAFGETVVTPNIWGYLWSKLCFISLLFATTLVDAPIYEVVRRPGADEVIYQLVAEAASVPLGLGTRMEELHGFQPLAYLSEPVAETLEKVARFYEGQTKVRSGSCGRWRPAIRPGDSATTGRPAARATGPSCRPPTSWWSRAAASGCPPRGPT